MAVRIEWMNKTAIEKYNLPDNWKWGTAEAVKDGLILSGGIDRSRPFEKIILSNDDIIFCQDKYEKETGNCSQCSGTGQEIYGCHRDTGNKYRDCKECNATGKTNENPRR